MIRIKCVNPHCTAPEGKFLWDENAHLKGNFKPAKPDDPEAISFVSECPFCEIDNKVWLSLVTNEDEVVGKIE